MTITPYDTNIISVYNAIKTGAPFVNTLGTPIIDATGLTDRTVGVLTNVMDNYIATGGFIGDSNWVTLNDVVTILDAPYLGNGGFAGPTVFDNLYPPLKYLLANNGDLSAVVQGMGIPLPGILNHTNTITESMPNILSAIGAKNSFDLQYLGAIETCAAYTGILGSLLGLGQQLLNAANAVVGAILGLALLGLSALLAGLAALLAPLREAIRKLYEMLAGEQSQLSQLYQILNDQALAALLAVTQDPCIRSVVNAIGNPTLKRAVDNINRVDSLDDFVPVILQQGGLT